MMTTQTMLAIIAIVAAIGLVGVLVIERVTLPQQEAEAGCERGHTFNQTIIKSNGHCLHL
jgi:Flp pilus assembly protein CpaB